MKWLVLIVCCLSSVATAKTYKCEINGNTSYQMSPCPEESQGGQIDVRDKQPIITEAERSMRKKNDRAMAKHYQKVHKTHEYYTRRMQAMANEARTAVEQTRKNKQLASIKRETGVIPGMTEKQVIRKLGKPKSTNKGQYSNGSKNTQQWVYRNGHYVYFENGIVTSQQW
ncbi:MAG: hypothetical protein GQ532_09890 [Methylomarinum sp.]|nr:hypothetical protein [Methylomarinum sp.]